MIWVSRLSRGMGMLEQYQGISSTIWSMGLLGVWHYWWQVKKDITEPLIYAVILTVLLGARIIWRWHHKKARRRNFRQVPLQ